MVQGREIGKECCLYVEGMGSALRARKSQISQMQIYAHQGVSLANAVASGPQLMVQLKAASSMIPCARWGALLRR